MSSSNRSCRSQSGISEPDRASGQPQIFRRGPASLPGEPFYLGVAHSAPISDEGQGRVSLAVLANATVDLLLKGDLLAGLSVDMHSRIA
jgi:hypothetical protein